MIRRLIVICITCLSLIFVQLSQVTVAGAEASDAQTYEMSLTSTNLSLSGAMTSKQLYFQVPDYWKVNDVKFNLDYKASPLTLNDQSSVTLKINGTYLHSFRPIINEDQKQHLSVTIPTELIVKGANELSIEGSIQTTNTNDEICSREDWQDNWLQIFSTSNVAVQHTNESIRDIHNFNQYFTGLDIANANQNAVVVPEQSDAAELEAAAYAIAGFAKSNSLENKAIPLLPYGSYLLTGKKAIVLIALYDHLPNDVKNLMDGQDLSQTALIQLVSTDKQPTLVITSQDADLLVKAGRLVANQALMGQLNNNVKVIDKDTNVATPTVEVNRNVVLTDNGDKLTGWRHQEKSYFVSLPANRSIAEASKISVDFRYAQNLDFERSMITVLINDTPIGSKKLTTELADGDNLTLSIPQNLNISGNFSVKVAFDLELKNGNCYRIDDQMPWAFITKDTLLKLNTTEKTDLLFNNYPFPFIRDGNLNRVAVVLPTERDQYMYQSISNLFNLLGRYMEGNEGEARFYEDKAVASDLKDRNIVAIGTYKDNKLIRDYNNNLYFQYATDGAGFQSNEKMSIDSDYGKRIGTLQLMQSPFEAGHALMAITGVSSEYYYLASQLVGSHEGMWKIYGDGVTVDKDGTIQAYRFKKQANPEETTMLDKVIERSDVLSFMVVALLILLLVLVSMVLMIRKYRKKRG